MRKNLFIILFILITAFFSFKTGYALFTDQVTMTFDLMVGEFDNEVEELVEILGGKPILAEDYLPGEWSEYGTVKLSDTSQPGKTFFMYTTGLDGNICPAVNIKIEVSVNGEGGWVTAYEGELEEIRGDNDKVTLSQGFIPEDPLYVRQQVQLDEDSDKNVEGEECLWDEVFTSEREDLDYINSFTVMRNRLSAYFWTPPSAEVEDPNGGEEYEIGEEITIKWKAKSPTHDIDDLMMVDIYLFDSDEENEILTIAENELNDGQFKWTIPEGLGGEYKIKIYVEDGHDLDNEDFSDESFTIISNEEIVEEVIEE